ncbi:MerR family DNA-binding transcriptional regulator [Phenylobacterium sp.]|uniref:MerR family transcriptional regulator n=1 Tax=Phenylobacterium sp. TaxID=1871053 RepID=UPI0027333461|nr:MerR family DNA-binding transcriptional regulator [Phenylobacterium sp.]MDP3855041.1 MerR family DNA-binding transcriptional regulator [Phenylobacterium sp.]
MTAKLRRPAMTFTITQLCREFGATARALRYYEDQGLLAPARQGMARVYSYRDRARLQIILNGKRVGLSLAEIRDILDLYGQGDGQIAQNALALRKFRERIAAFERQRQEIDDAIDELRRASARMEQRLAEQQGSRHVA